MKIEYIQISNILSFQYHENINSAPKILFDDGLNIIIGQNGSGKSTALEIINFLFKRVLLAPVNIQHDFYSTRNSLGVQERTRILAEQVNDNYANFRLDPNWDFEEKPQMIQVAIVLDDIDKKNIDHLIANQNKLENIYKTYSQNSGLSFDYGDERVIINIVLTKANDKRFKATSVGDNPSFNYLVKYNLYKELINLYNRENPDAPIEPLHESFALIGGYRNYNSYITSVSLQNESAPKQIQGIKQHENSKSTNTNEGSEPTVFSLVRLRIAEKHYDMFDQFSKEECEQRANEEPFLKSINDHLRLVNLEVRILLLDKRTWQYSFSFYDLKRGRILSDINSLSAGQKSIIHLIFEAYGRGELSGGVLIIDEPEIHLHYQFQQAYLKVIEELNKIQKCQYILVTHSESLINSNTITKVKRFTLNADDYTEIKSPNISNDQQTLIKILDNTRSTYAFFAKKVVLVEGDSDRYFFTAVLEKLYPELGQEIAILDIGGKGNYEKWKTFFESFGLHVYYIGDFDNVFSLEFNEGTLIPATDKLLIEDTLRQDKLLSLTSEQKEKFKTAYENLIVDENFLTRPKRELWNPLLDKFKTFIKISNLEIAVKTQFDHVDISNKIETKYLDKIFILKKGSIETYIGGPHAKLNHVIGFCDTALDSWLSGMNEEAQEIKTIIEYIVK